MATALRLSLLLLNAVSLAACTGVSVGDGQVDPEPAAALGPDVEPDTCDPLLNGCGVADGASLVPCCDWETGCRKVEACEGEAVYCRAIDAGGGEGSPPPDCDEDDPIGDGDGDIGDGDGDIGDGDGDIGDGDGDVGDGDGDVGDGDGDGDVSGLAPIAPADFDPHWQGQHRRFSADDGACLGHLAAAMGDQLTCYGHVDGELRCAGRLADTLYTGAFTGTGRFDARQILIRQTINAANGNGLCFVDDAGAGLCMGGYNDFGVYGVGHTDPLTTFTSYLVDAPLEAFGTGTFDDLCAKTVLGDVYCAGFDYGPLPVMQGPADWFWQDTSGVLHLDDYVSVQRVSDGRAEGRIRVTGLETPVGTFGTPGDVVQGGLVAEDPDGTFPEPSACWLETDKTVRCVEMPQPTYFAPGRVIALLLNPYVRALCAVYDDASLWCVGDNPSGMLGTEGDVLDEETRVQPPGSVAVGCGDLP